MRALVWTNPEVMVLEQREKPAPGSDEVLIRVEMVGICGSEIEGYLGHNSLRVPPLVMGHEIYGRVEVDVPGFTRGQQVVINPLSSCDECLHCHRGLPQLCEKRRIIGIHCPGGFSEWVSVPKTNVIPVPDNVSSNRAVLAEPLACSLRATRRALAHHPFANVLVFGAGGIGLLSVQVAKILGASQIIVADTNEVRLQMAKTVGADFVLNPRTNNLANEMAQLLGMKGLDVVVDAAGFQLTRETAMRVLNPGGTLMNIGLGVDDTQLPINHLIRNEIRMLGSFCYSNQDFIDAVELLVSGRVTENGWTEVRPLEAGGEAFADLVAGRVMNGKILLRVTGD